MEDPVIYSPKQAEQYLQLNPDAKEQLHSDASNHMKELGEAFLTHKLMLRHFLEFSHRDVFLFKYDEETRTCTIVNPDNFKKPFSFSL